VLGSYLHGLFSADGFRGHYLSRLGYDSSTQYEDSVEETLDALADHLEQHMDLDHLLSLATEVPAR
jgi:adenosylcobyric acid synthase